MSEALYTVIAHIRPKPGALDQLMALRAPLEEEFRTHFADLVNISLNRVEGTDEWRDIVTFRTRESLFANLETPAYAEWATLVDLLTWEILDSIS